MLVQDMIESNGKTVRENNLSKEHSIPLDTLVEVKGTENTGIRAFVVYYHRDCDGTPLYGLSMTKGIRYVGHKIGEVQADIYKLMDAINDSKIELGFSGDCLTVL